MNDKKALEIFEECVDELYKHSYPPVSWKEIKRIYSGKDEPFFSRHEIHEDKYKKIKEKYYKKLSRYYRYKLDLFLLDYAPMSYYPEVKQSRL